MGDIHIGEAPVLIERADGRAVFLDLRWRKASAFIEEGEEIKWFGLHHGAEVFGKNRIVAVENDFFDDELGAFGNSENDAGTVFAGDFLYAILHADIGVIPILVEGQNFLAVLLDFFIIHDIAGFDSEVAADAVERDVLGSLDDDFFNNRAALEENGHFHAVAERFCEEAHIRNAAGLVKGAHILFGGPFAVGLADLCGEIRKDTVFGNTRSAYCFDGDLFNDRASGIGGFLGVKF